MPDEGRAVSLRSNASIWLTLEKLLNVHSDVLRSLKDNIAELLQDPEMYERIENTMVTFERVEIMI